MQSCNARGSEQDVVVHLAVVIAFSHVSRAQHTYLSADKDSNLVATIISDLLNKTDKACTFQVSYL
jgi:hypothetical protein